MLALRTTNGKTVPAPYGSKSWPLSRSQGPAPRIFNALPQSIELLGGQIANFAQLYWTQPWVYTVTNKITRTIAALDLKTYEYDDTRTPIESPTSVPAKIFRNPYPRAGTFQLIEFVIGSLCVYGNATLVKARGGAGRTPAELWPMPFPRVTIIEGRDQPIEAYQYAGLNTTGAFGMKPLLFLPDDVVHFTWFNPDGKPWGRSPLEALATTLAIEDAGQRFALSHFANNARPASFVQSVNKMSKEQREELRAEIDAAYGGVDQAFKVALLDAGLDWKPISAGSLRDTALVENRQLSREEVCAVFDIPPPLVGILEHATYSNIELQFQMFYQSTIAPLLSAIEDTLNAQFINEDSWAGYFARFDMGEILRGNYEQRSQAYQRMFNSGILTPNELRALEGRKPIGDPNDSKNEANMIFVPVNTAPVGEGGMVRPLGQQTTQGTDASGAAPPAVDGAQNGRANGIGGTPQIPANTQ